MLRIRPLVLFLLSISLVVNARGAVVITDPANNDPDFAIQGEYVGEATKEGKTSKWGAQVIAQGNGKFHAVGFPGGLPGDGWDEKVKKNAEGEMKDGVAVLKTEDGDELRIHDGQFEVYLSSGDKIGTLKKVQRESPTLGKQPPVGAVVLYHGPESAKNFQGGQASKEGWLMPGVKSKETFESFTLHVEFLLPFMPEARDQGRGNSGCYMQGRYEVQMLDSFGLKGENNECGGVYSIAPPRINMCYPPLAWQTYDIDFNAAEFKNAQKVKNATMTVRHNGILIHENLELTHSTTASPLKEGAESGPVYLQNHGNPVRYRNVWVVRK